MRKILMSVVALCVVASFAAEQAKEIVYPSITSYGLAQYRLRLKVNYASSEVQSNTSVDYANRIGFYLGTIAKVNEQVTLQLQIGNDWISTEDVSFFGGNPATLKKRYPPFSVPYFNLAFAKYNPGFLSISSGIIPVLSYGSLDFLERSLATGTYKEAALVSWAVGSNNSLLGLNVGVPILKDAFKLGIEITSTVIEPRTQKLVVTDTVNTNLKANPSAVLVIGNILMSIADLSITPQFYGIANRFYNSTTETSDHELGGGLTIGYKIGKVASLSLFGAYAAVSNENSQSPRITYVDAYFDTTSKTIKTEKLNAKIVKETGLEFGIGGSLVAGPGSIIADVKYSNAKDYDVADSLYNYIFGDLKYSWNVNKNFSIMPRVRYFGYLPPESANVKMVTYKSEIRPELIFTGKF